VSTSKSSPKRSRKGYMQFQRPGGSELEKEMACVRECSTAKASLPSLIDRQTRTALQTIMIRYILAALLLSRLSFAPTIRKA